MIERLLTGVRPRTSISRSLLALLVLALFGLPCASGRAADAEPTGLKKRRPLPDEFGRVVMNNLSEKGKVAPVVFDHWVHRTRFTCRLCPGIFRGTLDVRARTITDEMCIAAAVELAKVAEEKGLSAECIMPTMDDVDVFPREAAAVAMKAIEQGIAKFTGVTFEQEYENAMTIILRARGMVQDAMAIGYIEMPHGSQPPRPSKRVLKAAAKATAKKPAAKPKAKKTVAKKAAKKLARKTRK